MKKSELASFIKEEILSALGEDKQTQQDIKDTEELTKATAELAKAKEEAGITENAGLINQIFEIIEVNGLDAMDVMEAIGQQFGVAFEFGRLEEANIGLADLEEMGYENGEKAFDMHFDKSILNNTPDTKAYAKGFVQAIIDSAGSLRLDENEDKGSVKEASYSNQYVDKNRIASNKYKQANDYKASYDSIGQVSSEKQFDDDNIDKKAVKGAKKNKGLAKAAEELAQLTKQMKSLARDYKEAEGEEKEKLVADLKKKTKLKKELEAIIDK